MAENIENNGCSQRDNAEHEGYVKASRSFNRIWKERDSAQPRLLEAILYKDNFNRAYKRVKANKGAPGIEDVYKRQAGCSLFGRLLPNCEQNCTAESEFVTKVCIVTAQTLQSGACSSFSVKLEQAPVLKRLMKNEQALSFYSFCIPCMLFDE